MKNVRIPIIYRIETLSRTVPMAGANLTLGLFFYITGRSENNVTYDYPEKQLYGFSGTDGSE